MRAEWTNALLGGGLIGVAVSLLLYLNGRVAGVSGILDGALSRHKGDRAWRWLFLAGLVFGGIIARLVSTEALQNSLSVGSTTVALAGILVGYGTVLGSGCTSGHGVCGISRLSPRSILATATFIIAGVLTVALLRKMGAFA